MRLSLRELMILVALAALAIASLKYASSAWHLGLATVTLLAFVGSAIVAIVDRGPRQAFAIGMVVTMTFYGALIAYGRMSNSDNGNPEFSAYGRLPTTRLLGIIHAGIVDSHYVDVQTQEVIPDYDPTQDLARQGGRVFSNSGVLARRVDRPSAEAFTRVGHCWWALLVGYVGGRFSRFVYQRRVDNVVS